LPRFFYTADEIEGIENCPGLYSVLCCCGGEHSVIDIGQSDDLRSAVENNSKKEFWHQDCAGTLLILAFCTYDMQESERKRLEHKIRERNGLREAKK
jgi:hypothetical protein